MNLNDLVLVSIDDHVVEPPNMFDGRLAAKYVDDAPTRRERRQRCRPLDVPRQPDRRRRSERGGLVAEDGVGLRPRRVRRDASAAYDIHARVRDMDVNGITRVDVFPDVRRIQRRPLPPRQGRDHECGHPRLQRLAHRGLVWCLPRPLHPIVDRAELGPAEAVAEIKRVPPKGAKAITLPELPHLDGLPSYHDMDHWGPIFEALIDNGLVMCLHIGQGFAALQLAPDGPIDNLMIMACQISMLGAQDLLWGPAFRTYPDLKVAFSEGGIGWIPFYLDRCDRHFTNQVWLHGDDRLRRQAAERGVPRARTGLLRHRPDVARAAQQDRHRHHRLGVRLPALRLDVARCPRADARRARMRSGATDEEIDKISWQNACRFFDWDPFPEGPAPSTRSAPCGPVRPTSTCRRRPARSTPSATRSRTAT